MSDMTVPTLKVKDATGESFIVINEADFDMTIHKIFEAPVKTEPKEKPKGKS